jgi:ribonuclease BN (tRNA processing enzyme)
MTHSDSITVLGAKGGPGVYSGAERSTSLLLIAGDERIIIDCGLGVTRAAVEHGIRLPEITRIFVSHHHCDHNLEFGPLVMTAWLSGLDHPLACYGAPGLKALWRGFRMSQDFDIAIRIKDEGRPNLDDLVSIEEFQEGVVLETDQLIVSALRVEHPPIHHCYALKFMTADWSVVFSADTAYFPPLAEFARGCDMLIHEALYWPSLEQQAVSLPNARRLFEHLHNSHTSPEDAGRIASAAGVGHLVLAHLVPDHSDPEVTDEVWTKAARTTWSGALTIAHDGLTFPIAPQLAAS